MKEEARSKAETIFREANGKISNVEIARQVGVKDVTVGKWKQKYDWAASAEKVKTPATPRKKEASEQALKLYLESGGQISNQALANKVGVSAASIANWKKAGAWLEKLPAQVPSKAEVTEELAGVEQDVTTAAVVEPQLAAVLSEAAEEPEECAEIEVDFEELACPAHFTVLNKRIDEMLGREYLSPIDLKIAAEAKEAALRAAAAYLEVLEKASRH